MLFYEQNSKRFLRACVRSVQLEQPVIHTLTLLRNFHEAQRRSNRHRSASGGNPNAQRWGVRLTDLLDALLRKKIDIRSFDQLCRFDAQLRHDLFSLAHPDFNRFIISENNFQFKKVPERLNSVDVDACSPH